MTTEMKYVVISVGCLECNSGESMPEVVGRFPEGELEIARIAAEERQYFGSQEDRFIIDLTTGEVVPTKENF